MEENGGLFYRKSAELANNSEVKKLFGFLASEEDMNKKHLEKSSLVLMSIFPLKIIQASI